MQGLDDLAALVHLALAATAVGLEEG